MSFGLIGALEVLPALSVPCGLASAMSFVCVVIDSSFFVNPDGREGAGMMSFGVFGGLEVLPAPLHAVRICFGSLICVCRHFSSSCHVAPRLISALTGLMGPLNALLQRQPRVLTSPVPAL